MMEEETRKRLGSALAMLGFIMILVNGIVVIGHYLAGWSLLDSSSFIIGSMFLVIGIAVADKKRSNP